MTAPPGADGARGMAAGAGPRKAAGQVVPFPGTGTGTGAGDPAGAMHVLFCANDAYIQHAAVAALSLLETGGPGPVVIHLMTTARAREAERMFAETLRPFPNARLVLHHVDARRLASAFADRYLTQEAYLRFLAPEVLPAGVGRVIYLDCDLVVLDDLRGLWGADLGGCAVGAVAECDWMAGTTDNRLTRLGIRPGHVYVNSGVLLMDLDRWRRDGVADRLFRFIAARGAELRFHDQDALNAVLQGEIALLDRRWNVQAMFFGRWFRRAMPEDHAATRAARRAPGIIHYTTASKPWKARVRTRKRALYHHYRDRTAWRHVPPEPPGTAGRVEALLSRLLLRAGLDLYLLLPSRRQEPAEGPERP